MTASPVVAIANQKGGVGKTTTAAALAVTLARQGTPVHLIDVDPQASLTRVFGLQDEHGGLYQALRKRAALPVVELTQQLTLTPSSIHLASGESQFLAEPAREYLLARSLEQTDLGERLVILDCPPSLGILFFNCLAAADQVLVTIHPGTLEVQVLPTLAEAIETAREHLNPKLEVLGAVLTKVDRREKIVPVIERNVRKAYPLLGAIPSETALKYAMGNGTLLDLEESRALGEYRRLAHKVKQHLWREKANSAA